MLLPHRRSRLITRSAPTLIMASGLGVDGEHGPLFSGIDLALASGFHAIQMPGGPGQTALLLTLAGRLKATHGTVPCSATQNRGQSAGIARSRRSTDIDDLEESVTVQTVLAEQRRWLAPWYSRVPIERRARRASRSVRRNTPAVGRTSYIVELSDLELFLLRITLAMFSNRPILVVGDLEQVRDTSRRAIAVERLGAIATQRTVVVGVTNPLGADAPDHDLHDHRIADGKGLTMLAGLAFGSEIKRFGRSRMTRAAIVVLMLLPLVYGALYLWAYWDPVRPCEQDAGGAGQLRPRRRRSGQQINAGSEIAKGLTADRSLDWHVVNPEEAHDGVEHGKYYFMLELPPDFSAAIASPVTGQPRQANLIAVYNDANNYISTSIGRTAISQVLNAVSSRISGQAVNQVLSVVVSSGAGIKQAADGAKPTRRRSGAGR